MAQGISVHCVRYSLKHLADAYKRFLADPAHEGKPRFKAKHFTVPAFTIPSDMQLGTAACACPRSVGCGWRGRTSTRVASR